MYPLVMSLLPISSHTVPPRFHTTVVATSPSDAHLALPYAANPVSPSPGFSSSTTHHIFKRYYPDASRLPPTPHPTLPRGNLYELSSSRPLYSALHETEPEHVAMG
jgi:hypothetical protein